MAQVAELELPSIEEFVEYGLQRRINIVVYNNYDEMQQSNIGLGIDWQIWNWGNQIGEQQNDFILRWQPRQSAQTNPAGHCKNFSRQCIVLDDLGEFAANQALLDLPKWLTDGYIEYAAENWYHIR